jgi:NTE family protein
MPLKTATQPFSRTQWLRRLASRRRDKVAVVLSGGGPLGALQVGALKALIESGITPDLFVGTSVGALNAAFLAFDPTPTGARRLEEVWLNLGTADLFVARSRLTWTKFLTRGDKVFENRGLRKLIETRLGTVDFEDALVPFAAIATVLESGEERVISSGPVTEALLASAAMPGVFPPVSVDGELLIDGGVCDNVPVTPAVEMGATTVYVIDATARNHAIRPLARPIDHLLHAFALARSQRFRIEQWRWANRCRVITVPIPRVEFPVPFAGLEFSPVLIEMAYEAIRSWLRSTHPETTEARSFPDQVHMLYSSRKRTFS